MLITNKFRKINLISIGHKHLKTLMVINTFFYSKRLPTNGNFYDSVKPRFPNLMSNNEYAWGKHVDLFQRLPATGNFYDTVRPRFPNMKSNNEYAWHKNVDLFKRSATNGNINDTLKPRFPNLKSNTERTCHIRVPLFQRYYDLWHSAAEVSKPKVE